MILDKQAALPSKSRYDIIIAGGGMVGLSLACALAIADKKTIADKKPNAAKSQPLSILLVDNFPLRRPAAGAKKPPPTYHPSFDARSTALSLASIEIYQTMGILPSLLQHAEAIRQIHVSDRGHTGSTLLDAEEQNKTAFGYVIENQWLGAVLLDCMADLPAIELVTGASVANIKPVQGGATVEVSPLKAKSDAQSESLQPPQTIEACLLVVADGAQSGLRKSLGISASVKQYQQQAVIANIQTQLPHHGQAFERFTADGAVAFLPLADLADAKNRSALVWTVPASESDAAASVENSDNKLSAQALAELSEQDFSAELQAAFGFRLGAIERVGQRQFYPLALTLSDEVYRNHIVIMGNAAHSLHPVAGQGFNLALRDVAALVERIINARQHNQDIGSMDLLDDYAATQLSDQNLTIGFSHNLIELFGLQALPVQLGRTIGLLALDLLRPAKNRFADQAAGLGGRKWLG